MDKTNIWHFSINSNRRFILQFLIQFYVLLFFFFLLQCISRLISLFSKHKNLHTHNTYSTHMNMLQSFLNSYTCSNNTLETLYFSASDTQTLGTAWIIKTNGVLKYCQTLPFIVQGLFLLTVISAGLLPLNLKLK